MRKLEKYFRDRSFDAHELAALLGCSIKEAKQKLTGEDDFTSAEIERIKDYFEISDEQMKQLLEYWS